MKKVALIALVVCMPISGCSKLDMVEKMTANAKTYDYSSIIKEKEVITGQVTLKIGDYVVYSDAGKNCKISNDAKEQTFSNREYIHLSNEMQVNITDGYVRTLDNEPSTNVSLYDTGVYLVGKDIEPGYYRANGDKMLVYTYDEDYTESYMSYTPYDYVEYIDAIPELFAMTTPQIIDTQQVMDLKEGTCVRLINCQLIADTYYDANDAASKLASNWKDTSTGKWEEDIQDAKDTAVSNSTSNSNNSTAGNTSNSSTSTTTQTGTLSGTLYLLKSNNDANIYINNTDLGYTRYWIQVRTKDFSLSGSTVEVIKQSAITARVKDGDTLNGCYLVGTDIIAGNYTIVSGTASTTKSIPNEDNIVLSEVSKELNAGNTLLLKDGMLLVGKSLVLKTK